LNVPEPPPPSGPIDCSTSPNDPSCKTTPGLVDCSTNPNDASCGPQPPAVDCKTNPDDPSCTQPPSVDCKANPNDASCGPQPVDCTTTPDDPSCKPDYTNKPDDPSCKVDCTTNPSDPSCPPPCTEGSSDCPPPPPCQPAVIGISCPPPPPVCKSDEHLENGKCVKCPDGSQPDNNGNCPIKIIDNNTTVGGNNSESKTLSLSIDVAKDPIVRGNTQTITVTVSDKKSHQKVSGANVKVTTKYVTEFQHECSDSTDGSGHMVCH
jgi:hypothetical protein